MLENLLSKFEHVPQKFVLYDIACLLQQHLQVQKLLLFLYVI